MASRRFNWPLWAGSLLSPVAFLSYPFLFERWPVTRDVPWANLLLFAAAAALLAIGLRRAWRAERRRIAHMGVALVVLSLSGIVFANFAVTVFVHATRLPASAHAPQVGQQAPDFTLPDERGWPTSLTALLSSDPVAAGAPSQRGVLLIFSMYAGCRACNSEFRGIQRHIAEFTAAGLRPVVISIDTSEASRLLSQEAGYTFTFLSDPTLEVIRRYDVADGDVARPAEFLVDTRGVVRWRNLTRNMFVRARPEQLLAAARLIE